MQLEIVNSIEIAMKRYKGNKSSVALELEVSNQTLSNYIKSGREIYVTKCGKAFTEVKRLPKSINRSVGRHNFLMVLPVNKWFTASDYKKAWLAEGNDNYNVAAINSRLRLLASEDNGLLVKEVSGHKSIYFCSADEFEKHVIGVER